MVNDLCDHLYNNLRWLSVVMNHTQVGECKSMSMILTSLGIIDIIKKSKFDKECNLERVSIGFGKELSVGTL